jgi:hypothetical protein
MKSYKVVFYYKNDISYKGIIGIQADSEVIVTKMVKLLELSDSPSLPQNYDRYEIKEDI